MTKANIQSISSSEWYISSNTKSP